MIHPQSIVEPGARIGKDVHIGPFTVIGQNVEIGDRTWIGPHAVINGHTKIGCDNKIFQFTSLGEAPQDLKYAGEPTRLEIGDRNIIREFTTISRGTVTGKKVTKVGSDNLFMAYVHIAHDCVVGDHTVFANCSTLGGHVAVGDHAVLGGFTGIHQFCRVGAHVMTGVATISFKDIPPYLMAYGNTAQPYGLNLRGLRRRGFSDPTIELLKRAYKLLYRSGLRLDEALEHIGDLDNADSKLTDLLAFIRSSERGIIR